MTITKFLSLLILLDLSFCIGCKDKEWTTLPPETQTGARTFGCYVNGELFVKGKETLFHPLLIASYYKNNNSFSISCTSNDNQSIGMQLNNVEVNISKPISEAYFFSYGANCYCFSEKEIGEIIITKFDTISGHAFGIVSGQFQFKGQCSDNTLNITGDSIVYVTNGRFDTVLGVYDN